VYRLYEIQIQKILGIQMCVETYLLILWKPWSCEGYSYKTSDGSAVSHFGYVEAHREVGRLAELSTAAEQGDVPRSVDFGVGICGTCVAT
jgi:hypothetical protein